MSNSRRYPNLYPPSAPPLNIGMQFSDVPPELVEDVQSGYHELVKQGMEEHEARVCLILDVSASMTSPR